MPLTACSPVYVTGAAGALVGEVPVVHGARYAQVKPGGLHAWLCAHVILVNRLPSSSRRRRPRQAGEGSPYGDTSQGIRVLLQTSCPDD